MPAERVAQWEHYARDQPIVDKPCEQMCFRLTLFTAMVQWQDKASTPNPVTLQNEVNSRGGKDTTGIVAVLNSTLQVTLFKGNTILFLFLLNNVRNIVSV